jgi:hypothetical protein
MAEKKKGLKMYKMKEDNILPRVCVGALPTEFISRKYLRSIAHGLYTLPSCFKHPSGEAADS